jgi:adenylylsulfate reductase subunit B
MPPKINPAKCTLCGICADVCPGDILHIDGGIEGMVRYPGECSHCDVCRVECPEGAITMEFPWSLLQQPITIQLRSAPGNA